MSVASSSPSVPITAKATWRVEVVALVACDVVVRDPGDRPEPVADERGDAADQDPVETPHEGGDLDGFSRRRARAAARELET